MYRWIAYGVLTLFIAVMAHATFRAYSRKSGSTGIDMSKIQKIRYEDVKSKTHSHTK